MTGHPRSNDTIFRLLCERHIRAFPAKKGPRSMVPLSPVDAGSLWLPEAARIWTVPLRTWFTFMSAQEKGEEEEKRVVKKTLPKMIKKQSGEKGGRVVC